MDLYARSSPYYDMIYGPIVDYEREVGVLEGAFARYAERPVRRVLDLGCGTGNHALLLAARGYAVLGVDLTEAFISAAEAKSRDLEDGPRFVVADMRDLGFDGRFDAVICMFGAFDHLPREEAEDTLRGFRDRLEPGGDPCLRVVERAGGDRRSPGLAGAGGGGDTPHPLGGGEPRRGGAQPHD